MRHIRFLLFFISFLSTIFKAYSAEKCEQSVYSFSNFIDPYEQFKIYTPRQAFFTKDILEKDNIDTIHKIKEFIKNRGVNEYVDASIRGEFPLEIKNIIPNQSLSLFDIAILNGAKEKTLAKITSLGYTISNVAFQLLYEVSPHRINLIKKYEKFIDFNSLNFSYNGHKLNIINYTIAKKDFKTLQYLLENLGLNNIYSGNLLDLSGLNFNQYSKLSTLINIQDYKSQLTNKIQKQINKKDRTNMLVTEYKHFHLINICTSEFIGKNADDVIFAVNSNTLKEQLKKIRNNQYDYSSIDKLLGNPIYSEVFYRMHERKTLRHHKIIKIKTIKELNKSPNIINLIGIHQLLPDEFHFLYDFSKKENYTNIRVDRIASYITSALPVTFNNETNTSIQFILNNPDISRKYQEAFLKISKKKRFGKNLSYYLFSKTQNLNFLKWVYNNVGTPKSDFGLSIIENLSISSIHDKSTLNVIDFLLQKGYKLNINNELLKDLKTNKIFLAFYNKKRKA